MKERRRSAEEGIKRNRWSSYLGGLAWQSDNGDFFRWNSSAFACNALYPNSLYVIGQAPASVTLHVILAFSIDRSQSVSSCKTAGFALASKPLFDFSINTGTVALVAATPALSTWSDMLYVILIHGSSTHQSLRPWSIPPPRCPWPCPLCWLGSFLPQSMIALPS